MISLSVFDLDDRLLRCDHLFFGFIGFSSEDVKINRLCFQVAGRSDHEIFKIITHQVDERFAAKIHGWLSPLVRHFRLAVS